jgi:4-alpha-glucanotransferase
MERRGSGILLHITSLPSPFGIGDLGPWAYRFADFLAATGQSHWQILPLSPTDTVSGNCPYSSPSAWAGNPLLISPELLMEWGLLTRADLGQVPGFPVHRCDYPSVIPYKARLLRAAYERFCEQEPWREPYERFCDESRGWLEDFALFSVIKGQSRGKAWVEWDWTLRDRDPVDLGRVKERFHRDMEREKFLQFLFFRQWSDLKRYCNERSIRIIGDMPIYVNHDGVDVWSHPDLFQLDKDGMPTVVSGVPPDYFSETGQRWGNPLYMWDVLEETGFDWWVKRFSHNLRLFDWVRVDHFRGFVGYWEIPASERTAVKGRWVQAPAGEFFAALLKQIPPECLIAEDLGVITPDVVETMDRFGFPGMRVLEFAFNDDDPAQSYLPHNYVSNCVVYTGTHDNNTTRGWWENEASSEDRGRVCRYVGRDLSAGEVPGEFIRLAMMSVARTVMVPMQDLLGLGKEARMNRPATTHGNWEWRLSPRDLMGRHARRLRDLTRIYGRVSRGFRDRQGEPTVEDLPDESPIWTWATSPVTGPWPSRPRIYEIFTWVWLEELSRRCGKAITLSTVPPQEWDLIASWGFDAVWLMGIWERSPAGRRMAQEDASLQAEYLRAVPGLEREDIPGSPYAVHGYVVDSRLGGPEALAVARERLAQRGLRLVLDYVPNHLAVDHPWVTGHPDYFVQGDEEDLRRAPGDFFRAGERVIACGRDPYFPPWRDTAQVHAFHTGFRQAAIETIRSIADQCDGVRCDMAMLLLNRIFDMTWGSRAGPPPERDFWEEIIGALRGTHPHLLLMAEVYWGLEGELHALGFDLCYDKVLYDRLAHDSAASVHAHLSSGMAFQEGLVRFLENHDEPRAAAAFPPRKHRAAAVVMATLPGARLFHEGQFQGRRVKLPVQLGRRPQEPPDRDLQAFYRRLLGVVASPAFRSGTWELCTRTGWPENGSFENLLAWCWGKDDERYLVAVNYSGARSQGKIRIPRDDLGARSWRLTDTITGQVFDRDGGEMRGPGLFVDLEGWGYHLFRISS